VCDGKSYIWKLASVLLNLVLQCRNKVSRELLKNLLTSLLELVCSELRSNGMLDVIVANSAMALEAQRQRIVFPVVSIF